MDSNRLKKDSLSILETIALSVGIMGPSASISVIVIMMASLTGYSAPLVLFISMVCVGLVSVSIIKLNQYFPSSGSVYYFAEKILGRRVGFISGWLIVFTYLMLGVSCAAIACSDIQNILAGMGLNIHWLLIVPVLLAFVWYLAGRDAKVSIRVLLVLEMISMSILLVLSILIISKASAATGLSLAPFKTGGNSPSSIAIASVFGFLAFSGFEGASSLGEESKNPTKAIPVAVASAIIISGIFFIIVAYAQILGFGLTPDGIKALASSDTPLADLSLQYLSGGISLVIMLCVSISFFSSTLGCVSAGARILFTMGRDGMLSRTLYRTNSKHQTPYVGINILIAVSILIFAGCFRLKAIDVGRYAATAGILTLLLSYMLATICAVVFFNRSKVLKGVKLIIPVLSICILGIIFFLNIYPVPEYPVNLIICGIFFWLIAGIFLSTRIKPGLGKE